MFRHVSRIASRNFCKRNIPVQINSLTKTFHPTPSIVSYNTLYNTQSRYLTHTRNLFEVEGKNTSSYNAELSKATTASQANNLINEMKATNIQPDARSYALVLDLLSKNNTTNISYSKLLDSYDATEKTQVMKPKFLDLTRRETFVLGTLTIYTVVLGLWPGLILDNTYATLKYILTKMLL